MRVSRPGLQGQNPRFPPRPRLLAARRRRRPADGEGTAARRVAQGPQRSGPRCWSGPTTSQILRSLVAPVQVPPRAVWGKAGQTTYATAEEWLKRELHALPSLEELVLRYLRAFGAHGRGRETSARPERVFQALVGWPRHHEWMHQMEGSGWFAQDVPVPRRRATTDSVYGWRAGLQQRLRDGFQR
ncbi:DNA glycosylase AlkZ-like family protein [Microtetraspora fusca]|uniref:DNA glycosylase AlkZ-like family protein n=1 Tax=Microtetraspora fusca TaxID=1997 RepID=A0ABW6V0S1_MICFU